MTWPTVTVKIGFASDPATSSPTYTDVTAYTRGVRISRGRQHDLDAFQAGTCTVTLSNRDRRFDPANTAGTYYPNVKPMRQILIQGTWSGVTYDLFRGFIESWPQSYPDGVDSLVDVEAVDGFKILSLATVSASYSPEVSGVRIGRILDAVGWPAGDRSVDTGQSLMAGVTLTAAAALGHAQAVETAEHGFVFINRSGKVRFADRLTRWTGSVDTVNDTWSDTGGHAYRDPVVNYDDYAIWNDCRVTRVGGTEQTAVDTTSQTSYRPRTLTRTGVLLTTDVEAAGLAQADLIRFKEPGIRIERIELLGANDGSWAHILSHDLIDKVRIEQTPPGGGAVRQQDSFIEGIEYQITPAEWQAFWNLSPIDGENFWQLDVSQLDTSTVLAPY